MFCPICKAEYREGFTRCADCDVELVPALPEEAELVNEASRLVWRGYDETLHLQIQAALREAGVPYFQQHGAVEHLYPSLKDPFQIWVRDSDSAAAEAVLATLGASAEEQSPGAFELPEASEEPGEPVPDDLVIDPAPEQAPAEVWRGDEPAMARFLGDSLHEVGIGYRAVVDAHSHRILVSLADQARARKIIRQIVERIPEG